MIMLRKGDGGDSVETLNKNLEAIGALDSKLVKDLTVFDSVTQMAVKRFQDAHDLDVDGVVGPATQAAITKEMAKGQTTPPPVTQPVNPLAERLVTAMNNKNYKLDVGDDIINIIYVEGMNVDGRGNSHVVNTFDDARIVLRMPQSGSPKILGIYEATTRPGKYWDVHPMNPQGAALLRLGQQTAWIVGIYHDAPALREDGPLELYRDPDHKYVRYGPLLKQTGTGIHHHGGYNYPHDDLGKSSAGCQVGRLVDEHVNHFMNQLVKSDARYKADHNFHFSSTILEYKDLPA